ncbi:MAG: hypothetical protein LBC61_05525 [Candidatus Peribacteria bacterium]|nr:hypothetical protein [Candidatus Peribacteria bacterium]
MSNYIFHIEDILFLNKVDSYWNKNETKEDCLKAIDDFLNNNKAYFHIDPYELVIDAFN